MSHSAMPGASPSEPQPGEVLSALQDVGWAPIESPLGAQHYSELLTAFRAVMVMAAQPDGQPILDAFTFNVHGLDHTDYYLQRKYAGQTNPLLPDRIGTDSKDQIHYGALSSQVVRARLGRKLPAEIDALLDIADETLEEVFRIGRAATKSLGIEPIFFSGNREDWAHILRGLDYHAGEHPFLGEAHFDRSGATATLYEEFGGLEGVKAQNGRHEPIAPLYLQQALDRMQPLPYTEFVARFFLGAGFNELPEEIRQRLGYPELLAHQITNLFPDSQRGSIVGFYNPFPGFKDYVTPRQIHTGFSEIEASLQEHIDTAEAGHN